MFLKSNSESPKGNTRPSRDTVVGRRGGIYLLKNIEHRMLNFNEVNFDDGNSEFGGGY